MKLYFFNNTYTQNLIDKHVTTVHFTTPASFVVLTVTNTKIGYSYTDELLYSKLVLNSNLIPEIGLLHNEEAIKCYLSSIPTRDLIA